MRNANGWGIIAEGYREIDCFGVSFSGRNFANGKSKDEYEIWLDGVAKECEAPDLKILERLKKQKRRIFVDTNISIEILLGFSGFAA